MRIFSSGVAGSGLSEVNVRLRLYCICIAGICALGAVLYWRAQTMMAAEYVELPDHSQTLRRARKNAPSQLTTHNKALIEKE